MGQTPRPLRYHCSVAIGLTRRLRLRSTTARADGGRRTAGGGRRTVDGGRWTVDGGRWTVDGGRWTTAWARTVDGERWTAGGGRWTADGGRRAAGGGRTAGSGRWTGGRRRGGGLGGGRRLSGLSVWCLRALAVEPIVSEKTRVTRRPARVIRRTNGPLQERQSPAVGREQGCQYNDQDECAAKLASRRGGAT